jgi:type III pantothenate kinase
MLLAVDIGNTNVTIGAYDGPELRAHWRVATARHRMADEWAVILRNLMDLKGLSFRDVDAAVIASVVPTLTSAIQGMIETYLHVRPLLVEPGIRTGVRVLYDSPKDVGADRIVNAVATFKRYGGPAIVIDFGTATTFDAISAEGDYLGGAIAPGIVISVEALFERTAKLPRVELVLPPRAIGKNTVHSIQSGLMFGYVGLVEGIVRRFKAELGERSVVIATGGLADVVASETRVIDHVDPYLTLDGLRLVYEMNVEEIT